MATEADIWRSANLLIKQHGADALIHASMRVDELLAAGDVDGRATWLRIVKAIQQLTQDTPSGPRH